MHQVKVYDGSGNLKKVISAESLNKRTQQLIKSPMLFRKKGKNVKSPPANIAEITVLKDKTPKESD